MGGGGIHGGQVIGRTSDDGMTVEDRPVSVAEVLMTVCLRPGGRSDAAEHVERRPPDSAGQSRRSTDQGALVVRPKQAAWWLSAQSLTWLCLACLSLVCLSGQPVCGEDSAETGQLVAAAPAVLAAAVSTRPAPPEAARPADESPIDLAILLDEHMVLIRMQVRHGDKPFFDLWRQFAESQFDQADKDHNGVLEAEELVTVKPLLAPRPTANNRNMVRGARRRNGGNQNNPLVDTADDADGGRELIAGVTRDEFVAFLRKTANGPVQITAQFQPSPASRALFTRLDLDHNDKLSASECEHAFDTLRPLDLDETDLFTQDQLITDVRGANAGQAQRRATPVRLAVRLLGFSASGPCAGLGRPHTSAPCPRGAQTGLPRIPAPRGHALRRRHVCHRGRRRRRRRSTAKNWPI